MNVAFQRKNARPPGVFPMRERDGSRAAVLVAQFESAKVEVMLRTEDDQQKQRHDN
jgi:hypothetical protein